LTIPVGTAGDVQAFEPELWSIIWLSLQVSGTALLMSSLAGIPLGAWPGRAQFRDKRLVAALVHTGMALPPVVVGLVVYLSLSRSGPLADHAYFRQFPILTAVTIVFLWCETYRQLRKEVNR
jgi:ABC-type tungstate transport system substrate-binding protein